MLKSNLIIAIRLIRKFKGHSLINILSLTIGITSFLFIFLYIRHELSYDRYHKKHDRIYRLVDNYHGPGGMSQEFATSSTPFAPMIKKLFPDVEEAARIFRARRMISVRELKYYEDFLFFADASIFQIFTLPLVEGSPKKALTKPNTVVLSLATAKKCFGDDNPIDRVIRIDNEDYLVTGVMKEMPAASHFKARIFASMKTLERSPTYQKGYFQTWAKHEMYTYLLLKPGFPPEKIEKALSVITDKYANPEIKRELGGEISAELQPLNRIHLHSARQLEISANGDIRNIYIFSTVALFILMIGCINYMNLTTAKSASRSREVSLRKIIGAERRHLVRQFILESLLFTSFAMVFSLVIFELIIPLFNSLTGRNFQFNLLQNGLIIGALFLILFSVGFFSGIYPALFFSQVQPPHVLGSVIPLGAKRAQLRRAYVVFQFGISITLIIGTGVIWDQVDFLKNRKLGFKKADVVIIPIKTDEIKKSAESIKSHLMGHPAVLSAAISVGIPGGTIAADSISLIRKDNTKNMAVKMIYTDHDFVKTMGMEIIKGRDFSHEYSTDASQAFLINEAAVKEFGLSEPLGTRFQWGGAWHGIEKKGEVIGVVKDFQYQSLRRVIEPLVIHIEPSRTRVFLIRLDPIQIESSLEFIKETWMKIDPEHLFEYSFLDTTFDRLYFSEEKLILLLGYFSLLAIVIATLGLFGLTAYLAEKKSKEIGIRKIVGATTKDILLQLSNEFIRPVILANLLAWPIALTALHFWLRSFSRQAGMKWEFFLLASVLAVAVALAVVSYQSFKATMADPVKSVRYE